MTIKELKEHCVRQITEFERIKEIMPITPNGYKHYEEHKIVLQLIEALEQQPCEDCISRQAVVDIILESRSNLENNLARGFFIDKIRDLPPVTPKPCEDTISRQAVKRKLQEHHEIREGGMG